MEAETDAVLTRRILDIIDSTFDCARGTVTLNTSPDEITGWDSLGHSVLLVRLGRKFRLEMTEEIAAPFEKVGDFVNRLLQLIRSEAHV